MGSFSDYIRKIFCYIIPPPSLALPNTSPSFLRSKIHPSAQNIDTKMKIQTDIIPNDQNISYYHLSQSILIPKKNTNMNSITEFEKKKNIIQHSDLTFGIQNDVFSHTKTPSTLIDTLTTKERVQKEIRDFFNCGDIYPQCVSTSDCKNITLKCHNNLCIPNVLHCSIKGCSSEYEKCNIKTGECESTRKKCTTNQDCSQGQICNDGHCYKELTFCRNDVDCAFVTENGMPKPKCDSENKTCVPCIYGTPSLCETIDPQKPSCHVVNNVCWERCDPEISDYGKCCDAIQILNPKAKQKASNRIENCCKNPSINYYSHNWEGIEKCCLDNTNSGPGKRDCRNWAGKTSRTSCCNDDYKCNENTGKCELRL